MKPLTLLVEVIHRSEHLPQGSQQHLDDATAQRWVAAGIARFDDTEAAPQSIKASKASKKE